MDYLQGSAEASQSGSSKGFHRAPDSLLRDHLRKPDA